MKKIVSLYMVSLILIFQVSNVYGIFSGDISIEQDSLNPLKFTATLKFLTYRSIDLSNDSIFVFWSNNDIQRRVPIFDTVNVENNRTIRIYKDTYVFPAADTGIKRVGGYQAHRPDGINNIDFGQSFQTAIYIEAGLNLNVLKSKLNTKALVFKSNPYLYSPPNQSIFHPSLISTFSSDNFVVELVTPLADYKTPVPVYISPHIFTVNQKDTSYVDSLGNFYWDTTYSQGYYCIAFKATEYLNGELLYFTMRDMLLTIIHQPTSITDEKLDANNILIYPNPTNQTHHLTFMDESPQEVKVVLCNVAGMKISEVFKGKSVVGYNRITNDVSTLASGFYIYSIEFEDRVENVSFIKF
jgi:hypothetical protein